MAEESKAVNPAMQSFEAFRNKEKSFQTSGNETPPEPKVTETKPDIATQDQPEKVDTDNGTTENTVEEAKTDDNAEGQSQSEKKDKPVNFEKRFKDTQKKLTEMGNKLKAFEKLTSRFNNFIQYDENGNPLDWNIPQQEQVQQKANTPEVPPEATEEEWILNPKLAAKKDLIREKFLLKQEMMSEVQEREASKEAERNKVQTEAAFKQAWNASLDAAKAEFPDFGNEESALFTRCQEIASERPYLLNMPDANYVICKLAAADLDIKSAKAKIPQKVEKKSTIMTLGKTSTGSSKPTTNLPPQLQKFLDREQSFRVRE